MSNLTNEFDQKAAGWDAQTYRVERARAVAERIKAEVPATPALTALEYGCGTGLLSFALQPELGRITLADSSIGMLTVLQAKISASQAQNLKPLQLDLIADPLPVERFDLIYTLMTLHHILDTDKMLRAFYTLLNKPGYVCVADLDKEDGAFHGAGFVGHHGFEREELREKANRAGFQSIRFSTVFHMPKEVAGAMRYFPLFLMVAEKH